MKNEHSPKKNGPERPKTERDRQQAVRAADGRRARKARTAPIAPRPDGTTVLGPYETTYPVSDGYGIERDIVQPQEET